ncbi:uncharacterized protein [Rutidosis leptorrhynchoides]|uniref:uncharacterized protein n=1 Tax=Rutidosis leptorrhynchoides TaxID=125765 RepID=UPI003A9943C3
MSSEFIVSNERGNVMQCTAKNNIAHCFIDRLQEGCVYFIGNFTVVSNKDEYRILHDNKNKIELQGSTYLKKDTSDAVDGFVCYPFKCIEFENLELTKGKYFIDVIGCVLNVGNPTPQKTGSNTVEFDLANQRGRKIKVTLWGSLGDYLREKKSQTDGFYCIILSSVAVKEHNGELCISSSTITLIIDDSEIPLLHDFTSKISCSNMELTEVNEHRPVTPHQRSSMEGTLAQLLMLARKGKKDVLFGNVWCDSCEKAPTYPKPRLQCDVRDDSAETDTCNSVLPNPLASLINTTHKFVLKTNSYYEHGAFESFNCIKVYPPDSTPNNASAINLEEGSVSNATQVKHSSPSSQKWNTVISTPAKNFERKKPRKFIIESSDSEDANQKDPEDESWKDPEN